MATALGVSRRAQELLDEAPVRRIPTDQIRPSRFQPRGKITNASVAKLARDMDEHGQIETGIVLVTGDETRPYELIAGERRWRACEKRGKPFRAAVVETDDKRLIMELALGSNRNREPLTGLDILNTCLRMRSEFEMDVTSIGASFGRSVQWASNVLACERLHERIKPLLAKSRKDGGISLSVGIELVRLGASWQLTALKRIQAGRGGQKTARKVVESLLNAGAAQHPDAQERTVGARSIVAQFTTRCTELRGALRPWKSTARTRALGQLGMDERGMVQEAFQRVIEEVRNVAQACGIEVPKV